MYQDAQRVAQNIDDAQHSQRVTSSDDWGIINYIVKLMKLQVAIKYEQEDIQGTKSLLEQCIPDDPDTVISTACLLYKVARACSNIFLFNPCCRRENILKQDRNLQTQ